MQIELRKFDIGSIKDDKVVVLIGKRDTGKSYLIRDILYHHRGIPVGTVMSGTESANEFYGKIVPKMLIHEEYDPAIVENALNRQRKIKKIANESRVNGHNVVDPRAFFIMDDCMFDQKWIRDKNIRYLFMNGRHQNVLVVIALQYALGIPPVLRSNIDFVFILRENNIANRKRLYDHYAGMFPSFETFCSVMDQTTENYECLVINNSSKSNKLEDQVFWYKAEPREDFRLCSPEVWAMQHERNHESDDEGGKPFDPSAVRKKRGPVINVKKAHSAGRH